MKQKPIILSFPGWGTNAKFMKFQMGDLHDLISKQFEIEYLEPTFLIDSSLHVDPVMIRLIPPGEKIYRWGDKFMNMQQDIENAKKRILEDDRIIGLMGFSQGTCIVFDIGQQCHQNEELRKRIKFLILFTTSGLKPDKKIYNKQIPIRIPTLQTIGTKDFLYFESLIQCNQILNPVIIKTDQIHRIPRFDSNQKKILLQFLKESTMTPNI